MINQVFQLVSPRNIQIKYDSIPFNSDNVLVKPTYLSICHADQRYYQGHREESILEKKLPMALIHEAVGIVVNDPTKTFKTGTNVMLIPNIPTAFDDIISENYLPSSHFLGSETDGFMQEFINMPKDRLLDCNHIDPIIASISEMISIGIHAVSSFGKIAHERRENIGIWGDGNVGFIVSFILKRRFPNSKILIIGQHQEKLNYFTFADKTFLASDAKVNELKIDHAFECTGNQSCEEAFDQIIKAINPEGTIVMLGVSENKIPIYTRLVLEKGLTLLGRSRSGKCDFEEVLKLLEDKSTQQRFKTLISEICKVSNIDHIHTAFYKDLTNPFKTVIEWNI